MGAAFGTVFETATRGDLATALRLCIDAAAGMPGRFDMQPARLGAIHQRNAHMLPRLLTQSPPIPLTPYDLGSIDCPTAVSWGARIRLCHRLVSRQASRLIPAARAVVVDAAGHLLPESDPEFFAPEVAGHIAWATDVSQKANALASCPPGLATLTDRTLALRAAAATRKPCGSPGHD